MKTDERKQAFVTLGNCLNAYVNNNEVYVDGIAGVGTYNMFKNTVEQAYARNAWFTPMYVKRAISAIATNMLIDSGLTQWLSRYSDLADNNLLAKKVGIIMAGNIPLVGFHDMLCVLLCGDCAVIKTSSKDTVLITTLANLLCKIEPRFHQYITFMPHRPVDVDAVISTGSNNSARYFESWYRHIPHIIRKNRSSVAILTGNETESELQLLGDDMFSYFGLGCRNVSTLFVPQDYDFDSLTDALKKYAYINNHKGYNDCYRYQKAILDMEEVDYYDTGFLLLKNSSSLYAPIALVNYQKYITLEFVKEQINAQHEKLQCVVCDEDSFEKGVRFGQAQHPQLYDYADGIDTLRFLLDNKINTAG